MRKEEIRILTPTAMLGYGFPEKWFNKGLDMKPDVIAVDSGSTDSGPHKLGLGDMTCSKDAYQRDISKLLKAVNERKIPLFISSAGGAGTNEQVDIFLKIIKEISQKNGYHFNIAAVYSEVDKNYLKNKLKNNKIKPCGQVDELIEAEIDLSTKIVAQMGVEPYLKILEEKDNIDIIISGRTYDPVPIAALGIKNDFAPGLCWHLGKIMECGALCAEPAGKVIFGVLRKDHFYLVPLNPKNKCTESSVAAHTLYEKSHPYILHGPGGVTDLTETEFKQLDERTVKVKGSKFIPSNKYNVKLEGAKKVGFRSIFIAGMRDPIAIKNIDEIISYVKKEVEDNFDDIPKEDYKMIFHLYGKNGVMGENELEKDFNPLELGIILEVLAQEQELSEAICSRARTELLHAPYHGRIATAGNIALPFTPLEVNLGHVCSFNIYHLMEIDDPTSLFPIKYLEV